MSLASQKQIAARQIFTNWPDRRTLHSYKCDGIWYQLRLDLVMGKFEFVLKNIYKKLYLVLGVAVWCRMRLDLVLGMA